jgi:hypothetical protein
MSSNVIPRRLVQFQHFSLVFRSLSLKFVEATGYPELDLSCFSSVYPGEYQDITSK